MKRVYIVSSDFDPADGGIVSLRERLTAAGLTPIVMAHRAPNGASGDDVIILRSRAVAILMIAAQLVIAAVILGYFSRFVPVAMTVLFWSLVVSAVFLASQFGAHLREKLLEAIAGRLARIEFAQKRPAAVWLAGSDLPGPIRSAAIDQAALHIIDRTHRSAIGGGEAADLILMDGQQSSAEENTYSDRDALIEDLVRRLAEPKND